MLQKRLTPKVLALIVALAVSQIYVQASLLADGLKAAPAAQAGQLTGRLTTRGNNPVTVNGNSAKSGETIFSGQQIQTPDGVGATIQLGQLGRVDIAPNTNLTLTFTDGRINVNLASGCVILATNRGVNGTIAAQGTTQQTDSAKGGALDICTGATPGAAPIAGQGAAAGAGAGAAGGATAGAATAGTTAASVGVSNTAVLLGAAGFGAIVVTTAIVAPCRRGANPSPGVPRGPNDECR